MANKDGMALARRWAQLKDAIDQERQALDAHNDALLRQCNDLVDVETEMRKLVGANTRTRSFLVDEQDTSVVVVEYIDSGNVDVRQLQVERCVGG